MSWKSNVVCELLMQYTPAVYKAAHRPITPKETTTSARALCRLCRRLSRLGTLDPLASPSACGALRCEALRCLLTVPQTHLAKGGCIARRPVSPHVHATRRSHLCGGVCRALDGVLPHPQVETVQSAECTTSAPHHGHVICIWHAYGQVVRPFAPLLFTMPLTTATSHAYSCARVYASHTATSPQPRHSSSLEPSSSCTLLSASARYVCTMAVASTVLPSCSGGRRSERPVAASSACMRMCMRMCMHAHMHAHVCVCIMCTCTSRSEDTPCQSAMTRRPVPAAAP